VTSFELAFDEEFKKEFGAPFIDIHRAYLYCALSDAREKDRNSERCLDHMRI
jgi:hypothetical protein